MVNPTCLVSFSIIVCRYFSKWRFFFLKAEKVASTPSPSDFAGLPYPPGKVAPPTFFMKMTAKDVKEITCVPLVTFFSFLEQPWKKP